MDFSWHQTFTYIKAASFARRGISNLLLSTTIGQSLTTSARQKDRPENPSLGLLCSGDDLLCGNF
jgi:hypothetical protein